MEPVNARSQGCLSIHSESLDFYGAPNEIVRLKVRCVILWPSKPIFVRFSPAHRAIREYTTSPLCLVSHRLEKEETGRLHNGPSHSILMEFCPYRSCQENSEVRSRGQ